MHYKGNFLYICFINDIYIVCVLFFNYLYCPGVENMTSVMGSGFGYQTNGNQVRIELRTLTNRIEQLTTTLSSVKEYLIAQQPDKKVEIDALFNPTPVTNTVVPVEAPRVVNPAVNRFRP